MFAACRHQRVDGGIFSMEFLEAMIYRPAQNGSTCHRQSDEVSRQLCFGLAAIHERGFARDETRYVILQQSNAEYRF